MRWFHLPIVNVSTPDKGFERDWAAVAGNEIRSLLRSVRAARPGAIETAEQEKYILSIGSVAH
jgi:hypothetical protein